MGQKFRGRNLETKRNKIVTILGRNCQRASHWLEKAGPRGGAATGLSLERVGRVSGRAKWAPALPRRLPRSPGAAHRPRLPAALEHRLPAAPASRPPGLNPSPRPATVLCPDGHACPNRRGRFPGAAGPPRPRPSSAPAQAPPPPPPPTPAWPALPKLRPRLAPAPPRPRSPSPAPAEPACWSSGLVGPKWALGGRELGRTKMAMQVVQAVQAVHLESDAFLVCLNHALSTEKEEVMGLCIGEVSRSVT